MQLEFLENRGLVSVCFEGKKRIDHRVANEESVFRRNSFSPQIYNPALLGHKQKVRQLIGNDPVDFLWHSPIKGTQASLDMRENWPSFSRVYGKLGGCKSTCQGGVHVTYDHYDVRHFPLEHIPKSFECLGGLIALRIRSYSQMKIWIRQSQIGEKSIGHELVIVFTGMHEQMFKEWLLPLVVMFRNCSQNRRDFHKIWTRTDNDENFGDLRRVHGIHLGELSGPYWRCAVAVQDSTLVLECLANAKSNQPSSYGLSSYRIS